ncbi:hypothetical protein GCM10027203_05720 [Nonomuraea fastidiosa]
MRAKSATSEASRNGALSAVTPIIVLPSPVSTELQTREAPERYTANVGVTDKAERELDPMDDGTGSDGDKNA